MTKLDRRVLVVCVLMLGIYSRLMLMEDPSRQDFAGYLSDRLPQDVVGPFNERA